MPLPRDGDVSALAKRLSELKRRTTTTTSPPKNAKNASKKSETNNIGETFDVEDRQKGRDQFASALKSAREKWKDRDGENVRTRTATMSPVHKSTREGREGRERERGKEQRSPNLGKPMRIPVEVGKKNGAEKDSRRRRNEFQPIPIKPSIEEANMNGSTSSSKDIDNFLYYMKETRQRKDAEFAVASAVESARSKIFMEVTNFLNEEMLPEDADVVSVAICEKLAELAMQNQQLMRSSGEAREIIDRLSAELNSFRDSCE
jgi:hypothetical protein